MRGIYFFCSAPTKELSQSTMKQGSHNFLVIIIFTNELPKGTNFDQWRYMLEVVFDKSPPLLIE